ncbi:pyranose oxidase [Hypomontagnella monticulosa]|nr:pyranose oxidase [Hypomontagnella monticulosa]
MPLNNPNRGAPGDGVLPSWNERKEVLQKLGMEKKTDVLIVGSGPIGAVYARKLVDKGVKVMMIDMGEQRSKRIGEHHKNSVAVQKDISLFTNVIRGGLSPLSVPVSESNLHLDPISWKSDKPFVLNGQNPNQQRRYNLEASAATRTVGGMSSHWTCCTPRQHPLERSKLFEEGEWERLYKEAEGLFETNGAVFDDSVRHRLVKRSVTGAIAAENLKMGGPKEKRTVKSMPLACKRPHERSPYIEWSCTATILGDLADPDSKKNDLFDMKSEWQCDMLHINLDENVDGAIVKDLVKNEEWLVTAKNYVVCAGAILTAGIMAQSLFKSGILIETHYPALGKYLTEQTMTFCQVALKQDLVDEVRDHPENLDTAGSHVIEKAVNEHMIKHKDDPLPFPFSDFDPQVYIPFSKECPWHTQIHRDAFGYGEIPADLDQRLVVDLRWFGYTSENPENKVTFDEKRRDGFGMPQPTFHFTLSKEDGERAHRMMQDMVNISSSLGGFIPGSEPRYLAPGLALHICGTYRAGKMEKGQTLKDVRKTSVVDRSGRVWGLNNLYLGGCGIIPKGGAANPTLTAACHAIEGAEQILCELGKAK